MKLHGMLCVVVMAMIPLTGALAQGTGPNLKADSAKEANEVKGDSAKSPRQPGATGSTVVPGSHSTVAGDQKATDRKQTGGGGGGK